MEEMVPDYENGFRRTVKKRHIYFLALYGIILLALVAGGLIWGKTSGQETFGSLAGRFESLITLNHNGKMLYYRENEITNYLLIGMDREELDSSSRQNGGQADFLLMLSIDRRYRTITPVMIDRDTMTQVTTYGIFGNAAGARTMQVCLAQAYSGEGVNGSENTARSVSGLLRGVKINRCLVMDLNGIALLNDAVGGVTVTITDDLTALDPSLKKGATVRLEGDLAEQFVRGRMTVADGTNASRMRRQQIYIDALVDRMEGLFRSDAAFLEEVFEKLSGHVESDITQNVLLGEVNAYGDYTWKGLRTLPGSHSLGADGFAEFWIDEAAALDMIADIWFD